MAVTAATAVALPTRKRRRENLRVQFSTFIAPLPQSSLAPGWSCAKCFESCELILSQLRAEIYRRINQDFGGELPRCLRRDFTAPSIAGRSPLL